MQLTCSVVVIGWIIWTYFSLDNWIMILQAPIIFILALKGMIIYSYNQIVNIRSSDFTASQSKLKTINTILIFLVTGINVALFIYSWSRLLFQIITVLYMLIIFIWVILDQQSRIITKTAAKITSLSTSFLLIGFIVAIIPILPIYLSLIASILL